MDYASVAFATAYEDAGGAWRIRYTTFDGAEVDDFAFFWERETDYPDPDDAAMDDFYLQGWDYARIALLARGGLNTGDAPENWIESNGTYTAAVSKHDAWS